MLRDCLAPVMNRPAPARPEDLVTTVAAARTSKRSAPTYRGNCPAHGSGNKRCVSVVHTDVMTRLDSVERAVADIAAGKAVVVIDDEDRENEGDLIFAAEKATRSSSLSWCATHRVTCACHWTGPSATGSGCCRCMRSIR